MTQYVNYVNIVLLSNFGCLPFIREPYYSLEPSDKPFGFSGSVGGECFA